MMRHPRRHRLAVAAVVLSLAAGLGAVAATSMSDDTSASPSSAASEKPLSPLAPPAAGWKEVDQLAEDQKIQAALDLATKLRSAAQQRGDQAEWTRGLIREVQLTMALHGYETAVRFLREQPWPTEPLPKALLDLFYAQALVTYQQSYGWEIGQREEVASTDTPDLKAWTREQIYGEAQQAFLSAWQQREGWGPAPVGLVEEFVAPGDFPADIRGTLRDAVTYLFAELLADSSQWGPKQSNEIHRLPLDELIAGRGGDPAATEAWLGDPAVHPLAKLAVVLGDLETWHREGGREEASFEARRHRLEVLRGSFAGEEDRAKLREDLRSSTTALGETRPWWAMGIATLAEWVRDDGGPDALVRARELARTAVEQHPKSLGGRRAAHVVASIEVPQYSLASMATDAARKRSIAVLHRNVDRLYFRAYGVDIERTLTTAKDYNLLPAWREVPELMRRQRPVEVWSVDLPETPDYQEHRTYVTPPLEAPGLFVVVASTREDFAPADNRLAAVNLLLGDLVLLTQQVDGGYAITALSGGSGKPAAKAIIELWRFDWGAGHRLVRTATTDGEGRTTLEWQHEGSPHFLLARHAGEIALDPSYLYPQRMPREEARRAALVYTDRSVYRPGQQLHWKVVGYGGQGARFRTLPQTTHTVELVDANGESVESTTVVANTFGSASGTFTIPAGRLLGGWHLRSSVGGMAMVRVEEYKRPTFEVSLKEAAEDLRLNRPAVFTGEARYYFGLPVTAGAVRWTVSRQPLWPSWWGWWFGGSPAAPQIVAAGASPLRDDGTFEVHFTPEADERESKTPGISYRYVLEAEATDEGGETRSAERSFRLGFVAVEANIEPAAGFFLRGEPAKVTVRRTDLDGAPRAGEGSWRLVRLRQPAEALLPADQPIPRDPRGESGAFETAGDRLRPRWETSYSPEAVLAHWEDGDQVGAGTSRHGEQGLAEITLPALPAGPYRLRYRTVDSFGAQFEVSRELLVVEPGATPLELPSILRVETPAVAAGGVARVLVHSGLPDQRLVVEIYRRGLPVERRVVDSSSGAQVLLVPVGEDERGGFSVKLQGVRDHQLLTADAQVMVPWDDRKLQVEIATFRDEVRPRTRETWTVTVRAADGGALEDWAAELLAYMYDRSLDLFAPHHPADPLAVYPGLPWRPPVQSNLGVANESWAEGQLAELPGYPSLGGDRLRFLDDYGVGGPGRRRLMALGYMGGEGAEMAARATGAPPPPPPPAPAAPAPQAANDVLAESTVAQDADKRADGAAAPGGVELRSEFAETAFWHPHLLVGGDGSASFEFSVPDSVTEWNLWVQALTADLRAGSVQKQVRTVKELMVRPYLPRFLRETDEAVLQVVVNNAGKKPFTGQVRFEIFDPETGASLLEEFGLPAARATANFEVEPGRGTSLSFPVAAPARVGPVEVRVTAQAGDWSDGELRSLPVLPGRTHLVQSRFATLRDSERRVLRFADLAAAASDPTLVHDQLVVTVDGQLFNTVLEALPYLTEFPYECTEQTLNRFLSTAIVSQVFTEHPALGKLGEQLAAQRDTPLPQWSLDDPNRRMALEESPWLVTARGGDDRDLPLHRILDPKVAQAQRDASLAKLRKAQTSIGGFPWWPGGPPSPYMTLYLLAGFSRALEHGVEVPQDVVVRAWDYLHRHYVDDIVRDMRKNDCCWESVTFLNFVLSSYPEVGADGESWTGGVFTDAERREMLDFSFEHWRRHSPLLKGQLALTLHRAGRTADAQLVWDSVMDSAKTTPDEGTHWAPEDRAWLWYNDTTETHAFALRTLSELAPKDARRHGLVQWLLLDKKLNHWKSTRATAEAIYALVNYLEAEGALGIKEEAHVQVADRQRTFRFLPDRIGAVVEGAPADEERRGGSNQLVIPGEDVTPAMADVVVEKDTRGFLFASATWHFSTERLPEAASGDFFAVTRTIYRRVQEGDKWRLVPLAEGAPLRVGDQLEVQLSIRSRHAAEYVHLRDPRPAGAEPETLRSGYRWESGLGVYEEIRDSGANFFFEWLPAGEYTFRHRLRIATAGTFRVAPATLQSMYAPEFAAYSAGQLITAQPAAPAAAEGQEE
jgi:uncharacterized protein YfaS (alpha-2-macroglobulin family)